jgi:phospholipid transport system substrate-binding protein
LIYSRIRSTEKLLRAAMAALVTALVVVPAGPVIAGDTPAPAKVAPSDAAPEIGPVATPQVERLHATLIDIMQNADKLGYNGRFGELRPVVVETFDLPFMASKSVGRHWKSLGDDDKTRWNDVFVRLITANYAGRFDAFSGEHFETVGEEPAINDTRVVLTRLVIPDDEDVQLNYRLRKVGDEWRIIDIYLNGTVSELALRRSEYSAVLKRDGFEKLLTTLTAKVDELSEG